MKRLFSALAVLFVMMAPGANAKMLGQFETYEAMEKAIAARMAENDFGGIIDLFDPKQRMISQSQRSTLVGNFSRFYTSPLIENAKLYEDKAGGGFQRAIYAYWGDNFPAYLYVVTQKRNNGIWVQQFNLEGQFSKVFDKW